jgi:hypothetical protein
VSANDFRSDPPVLSLAVVTGVRPEAGELLLTVPTNRERSAHLVGRVEYDDGTPATDVQLLMTLAGMQSGELLGIDEQGAFRSEAKLAGEYRLMLRDAGQVVRSIEGLVLETGRDTDAGVIVVEKPATLVLKPTIESGIDPAEVHFWLRDRSQDVTQLAQRRPDGSFWSRLPAGDYELQMEGELVASRAMDFTLSRGQTLEIEVQVERGVPCTVSIELPYDPAHEPAARARVLDVSGAVALESTIKILDWETSGKRRAMRTLLLRPGSYDFELLLDGHVALAEPMQVVDVGAEGLQFEWRIP